MANAIDIKHLDRRTVARYIERGLISQADYDKYLQQLGDVSDRAEPITVQPPDAIEDEGEQESQ